MRRIVALILCLLMVVFATGCSEKTGVSAKTLEQALEVALHVESELFDLSDAEFVNYIEDNNDFDVISFSQSGDVITAEIKVVSPNLYDAAINLASEPELDNEDEVNELLIQEMKNMGNVSSEVSLEFEVLESEIKAILTDEFLDAYYGGVFKLREQLIEDSFSTFANSAYDE